MPRKTTASSVEKIAKVRQPRRVTTTGRGPTIRDVAARAGVSIATVSNVLDDKSTLFTPLTAERVLTAARELGYQRNNIARSLVRRNTLTLGFCAYWREHTRNDSYFSAMLYGFLDGAANFGYQVKVVRLNEENPQESIRHLEDGSIDGAVIVSPRVESGLLEWAQKTIVPSVISGYLLPLPQMTCVGIDDIEAMRNAVDWLVENGHQEIAFLNSDPSRWSSVLREQGVRAALQQHQLLLPDHWMIKVPETASPNLYIEQLLSGTPRPTAILCYEDWYAAQVVRLAREMGLRVPQDISVMGFNNDDAVVFSTQPHLDSISHPIREIGFKAAQILIQRLQSSRELLPGEISADTELEDDALMMAQTDPLQFAFRSEVVKRGSVAAPLNQASLKISARNLLMSCK